MTAMVHADLAHACPADPADGISADVNWADSLTIGLQDSEPSVPAPPTATRRHHRLFISDSQ